MTRAGRGEKTAIYFDGLAICYREVAEKVMRVARNLVADGLLPEQRVLVCMQDRPEFAYAWFGALKAGAVVTQINPLLPASDYEYYLSYVKPQFAFIDEQSLPQFWKALANSRHCGGGDRTVGMADETLQDAGLTAAGARLGGCRNAFFIGAAQEQPHEPGAVEQAGIREALDQRQRTAVIRRRRCRQ